MLIKKTTIKFVLPILLLLLSCDVSKLFALEIKSVEEKQLDKLVNKKNNPGYKMFYFFTTWCSECRRSFRMLIENQESLKRSGVTTYYVSLDYQEKFLRQYMLRFNHIPGEVYFIKNAQQDINLFFRRNNIKFDQSVPFIVIFDEENRLTASGGYEIKNVIDSLKAKLS